MKQQALNRRYYKSIGYCPRCNGRSKLMPGENCCPDCAVREYRNSLNRDRKHYNEYHAKWCKVTYNKRKEQGVCVRCGKLKAKAGQVRCEQCIEKDSKARLKRDYHPTRFERGLCRWCDSPVEEGYRVCKYHHEMNRQKGRDSAKKRGRG